MLTDTQKAVSQAGQVTGPVSLCWAGQGAVGEGIAKGELPGTEADQRRTLECGEL